MKKNCLLIFPILLFFSGCRNTVIPEIDGYTWEMTSVLNMEDGKVIACGEDQRTSFEDAKLVEITCLAEEGMLTLTNITDDSAYSGTYSVMETDEEGVVYQISVGDREGVGVTAMTTYLDNSEDGVV